MISVRTTLELHQESNKTKITKLCQMDVASDSSSSTLSITFSEDSTAKRAEAAMEDFGRKLAAAKQASQGFTQDSEEELIQLEYGSSKRSTSQLISMIDNTEVSPLTGTQGCGFMG
jgi:hypothetical protein